MRLRDGGEPEKTSDSTALLRVNVLRNKMSPVFEPATYSARVKENLGYGNRVTQVTARDDDKQVKCTYTCITRNMFSTGNHDRYSRAVIYDYN